MTKGQKEKAFAMALGLVLMAVVVKQFVFSDEASGAAASPRGAATTGAPGARGLAQHRAPRRGRQPAKVDAGRTYQPLPLQALAADRQVSEQAERNIFVYYVPPPPPKIVEPAVPPPLSLRSVDPTSVYAGAGDFTLRVSGGDFPEDGQIFINGQPVATARESEAELSAKVERSLFATPGELRVEVKDGTGELYSNPLSIRVEAPPKPSYKFIGRIDDLVYFQKGTDERVEAHVGETMAERWRVAEVGDEGVLLEDVAIGIQHTIPLEEAAPITSARRFSSPTSNRFRRRLPRTNRQRPRPTRSARPTRPTSNQKRKNPQPR